MTFLKTRTLTLAVGAQLALAATAMAQAPPPATISDDATMAQTLSSAWSAALTERTRTEPLMTPEQKLSADAGYTNLTPAVAATGDAGAAAVDASAVTDTGVARDAVARVETPVTYDQLRKMGKANEKTAFGRKREVGRYDPPMQDDKGYYFDVVQTWNYKHVPRTDDTGLNPPEYYAALRCRAAPRNVGPLADNPNWKRSVFWRVCPDSEGKYRPTM